MPSPTPRPDDPTVALRSPSRPQAGAPTVLKIVIAGGFGAGKTTAVGAVSEITPLSTEEYLTEASADEAARNAAVARVAHAVTRGG